LLIVSMSGLLISGLWEFLIGAKKGSSAWLGGF
jgi:hypothetical protein